MNLLILRILTLLAENLGNKSIINKFVNLINKVNKFASYYSNPLQKITNKIEDIYQWLNPFTYLDLIKKVIKRNSTNIKSIRKR
ncbi:hypothetical protein [Spiroplasma poulsonii]|uniref:Uncharacterized protein n=1 Tax=Spiroplasma poulsonii TaxID=2138 RepID=A0A2P6F9D2_9MOLU|nr:hypothetical protein [Spiroplasma poulsonii]PQM30065.1 hypothetical protein SMSRO_SF025370 [Spiroplasma poulsonii]